MDSETAAVLRDLIELLKQSANARDEFQRELLEELRKLNRTLEGNAKRQTVGDL